MRTLPVSGASLGGGRTPGGLLQFEGEARIVLRAVREADPYSKHTWMKWLDSYMGAIIAGFPKSLTGMGSLELMPGRIGFNE